MLTVAAAMFWLAASTLPNPLHTPNGDLILKSIAGIYDVNEKYVPDSSSTPSRIDQVMEIVPLDAHRAYVRVETWAANYSQCSFHEVAEVKQSRLLYSPPDNPDCSVEIRAEGQSLLIKEIGPESCHALYCGAQNGLSFTDFPLSKRHPIKYMDRLLSSETFKAALTASQSSPIASQTH